MTTEALVSVIIPTFRRPRRLQEALASVGNQSYSQIEVIVINNGGADMRETIQPFQNTFSRAPELLQLEQACTIGAARNIGIRAAGGDFIAFLDDDDCYRPNHIARLAAALQNDSSAALAYDEALIGIEKIATERDARGVVEATCRLGLPYDYERFRRDDYIVTSTILCRKSACIAAGYFDEDLLFCEDWDFLLKMRNIGKILFVPGEIGVDYSMRLAAQDNSGSVFDSNRRAALDLLAERHHLPPLAPKTFLDVAHDLGCLIEFI